MVSTLIFSVDQIRLTKKLEINKLIKTLKLEKISELKSKGFTVLKNVFHKDEIHCAREIVLKHRHLLKNTRPTKSSGHIAGFHRYPEFKILHSMICVNKSIQTFLREAMEGSQVLAMGLTDITINRSQEWHTDLLRGKFNSYLNEEICWGKSGGGVFKVLVYLQDKWSLKVVPGSHLNKISLSNDSYAVPNDPDTIENVSFHAGDIVVMDIRLAHRGSSEEDMKSLCATDTAKILVSSAFGRKNFPLTRAMEAGNIARLRYWNEQHQ
jgi:hypothetical protein